ncbi:unnamed protein product [Phytophthora fragariaefolia]|uniref:Unnamed protein product n=1 Tax=Phytophthora fragariaefolia TaxID=1490495 RepID=A0A9W6XXY3_9STRA|nr:unnamed protein product [Phytophthora fragariaefolia]
MPIKNVVSTPPSAHSLSTFGFPTSTPTSAKQRLSQRSLPMLSSENLQKEDTITTSFSKLLQLMTDTTHEFDAAMKPFEFKPRSRANTAPSLEQNSQIRRNSSQPLTPNYAKPTLSTMAMARPASVDAKSRLLHASPFLFPTKNQQASKAKYIERPQAPPDGNKKYLPSDTNEFQEGSFVYFLSSEALPAAYSFADPEDQAQVARVIKTLPSGECGLQLYRQVPSRDSPQNCPNKTRSYFATPHFIDCCSTLLHTIPNITFDPQTNTCEWHVREQKPTSTENSDGRSKPTQNNSPPTHRHFYTQVLARLTFTPANLAEPISQATESMSPGICLPCPSFAECFRVPVAPTVFPKVRVSLTFEPPERFPRCSTVANSSADP